MRGADTSDAAGDGLAVSLLLPREPMALVELLFEIRQDLVARHRGERRVDRALLFR